MCPHCGDRERIGRLSGKTTRPGLRKCHACRKPFTVRIGIDLRGQPSPAAPVAASDPSHVRQQEGHQHPPNPADAQVQHEDRLVSDAPHPRGDGGRRQVARWAALASTWKLTKPIFGNKPRPQGASSGTATSADCRLVERGGRGSLVPCRQGDRARDGAIVGENLDPRQHASIPMKPPCMTASAKPSRATEPSTIARTNTFAATCTPTPLKASSRSSSAACRRLPARAANNICTAISPSSISATTASSLGVNDKQRADRALVRAPRASGSPMKQLVGRSRRLPKVPKFFLFLLDDGED